MPAEPDASNLTAEPAPSAPFWRRKLHELFGIDLRSLALYRIVLGLVILGDLFDRSLALTAHYTDVGVMPRRVLVTYFPDDARFCLHMASGGLGFQIALFILAAVFALMLLVGYRTKLATIVSWAMLLSLQNRNPLVGQSGDVLFRLLAFWAMFLPLGRVWSVDAWKRRMADGGWRMSDASAPAAPSSILHTPSAMLPPSSHLSVATVAILLQACFVYWFAYMLKTSPIWHEGRALYYALNSDFYLTGFGEWLRNHDTWLAPLTLTVLYTELCGPFVPFIPIFTGPIRTLAALGFMAMHIGFRMALYIGIFPWVSILGWTLFLPAWFWERSLIKRFSTGLEAMGDRVLTALFRRKFEQQQLRGAAAEAFAWPNAYEAEKRGKRFALRQLAVSLLAFACLIYITASNLSTHDPDRFGGLIPATFDDPARFVRLDQRWGMFAPQPPTRDFWFVMVGRTTSKRDVDVWGNGGPITDASYAKPKRIIDSFNTNRWHKYMENMTLAPNQRQRQNLLLYLCHRWNEGRSETDIERVSTVSVWAVNEITTDDYIAEPTKELLLAIRCPSATPTGTQETLLPPEEEKKPHHEE